MKILSASQFREADRFTILNEPITSINLMERAVQRSTSWILSRFPEQEEFIIFCGPGNNGGDGLGIARHLLLHNKRVKVFIVNINGKFSDDFLENKNRLIRDFSFQFKELTEGEFDFEIDNPSAIIIDSIFGNGLTKPIVGWLKNVIAKINKTNNLRVAIDMPSGLGCDDVLFALSNPDGIVKADYTLTFQSFKLSLLLNEGIEYAGRVEVLDIGLSEDYFNKVTTDYFALDDSLIRALIKKRPIIGYKGTFGHALLICGSAGLAGAAALAAKASLRSGCGMVTVSTAHECVWAINSFVPEAMTHPYQNNLSEIQLPPLDKFQAIGLGCGLGVTEFTTKLFKQVLNKWDKPLVIDADGLNILSENKTWLAFLPKGSILTPHLGEFDRLFNLKGKNSYERLCVQQESSVKLGLYIVLKNHRTSISTPRGKLFFNTTGNNGMATAGSGDVLTGIITGLLAQRYEPLEAALLGVYLHGLSGDLALKKQTHQTLIASDIIENLSQAYRAIE